jgi:hypothetical protein
MNHRSAVLVAATALSLTAVTAIILTRPRSPAPAATRASASAAPIAPVAAAGSPTLTDGPLLPDSPPARLEIPTLRVTAPITNLGLEADGTMQVPTDAHTVGWFTGAPAPGSLGPAVLAGHVDFHGEPGTFAHLSTLLPKAQIRVTRQDGSVATFRVTHTDRYPKAEFPTEAVYGPINHAGLRLITCGGDFNRRTGHYTDNIIVFAALTP